LPRCSGFWVRWFGSLCLMPGVIPRNRALAHGCWTSLISH